MCLLQLAGGGGFCLQAVPSFVKRGGGSPPPPVMIRPRNEPSCICRSLCFSGSGDMTGPSQRLSRSSWCSSCHFVVSLVRVEHSSSCHTVPRCLYFLLKSTRYAALGGPLPSARGYSFFSVESHTFALFFGAPQSLRRILRNPSPRIAVKATKSFRSAVWPRNATWQRP